MTPALFIALVLAAAPAQEKVLVLPLTNGEGVSEGVAKALTDALAGEVRKRPVSVLTQSDVAAVVSVERQKQLLGCSESSCLAELGGALGADRIVSGSVAKLGASWLIHVQLIDAKKSSVIAQADRRKKGGTVDDLLDELPAMAQELFGAPGVKPAPPAQPAPSASTSPAVKLPPPALDEPEPLAADAREKLTVLSDGQGHFLAVKAFDLEGPLYAGDAHALSRQLTVGGGAEGEKSFELVFWDPRFGAGAERSLDFRDGKYRLTCGKKEIAFTALAPADAKKLLASAKLFAMHWRRQLVAIGLDDSGTYYLVDAPRSDEPSDDLHLYVGTKGAMHPVAVRNAQREAGFVLLQTDSGALKLPTGDAEGQAGSWTANGASKGITSLSLWKNAAPAYTTLGAYAGEHLGTACDPYVTR